MVEQVLEQERITEVMTGAEALSIEQVRRAVSLRPSSGQHPLSYDDIPYHLSLAGVGAMTDI